MIGSYRTGWRVDRRWDLEEIRENVIAAGIVDMFLNSRSAGQENVRLTPG